jgi:hypothetical protein
VVGFLAGAACGGICMYYPHNLFWGEAQLQSLIDKGRTPLPVFGFGDDPTAALVTLGRCMIDPNDAAAISKGFSIECSLMIAVTKVVVVGLSLGTGIIGGHFWGPLFVGCSASHLLTDSVRWFDDKFGFGGSLAAYPCVAILCVMGSAHVVTFRAHIAIMLILTLTISAFNPEVGSNSNFTVSGDYSAVFPLLTVAVFVSLMVSRTLVFYKAQRSRGDIVAIPEVLCQPGMEGRPMVVDYDASSSDDDDSSKLDGHSDDSEEGYSISATSISQNVPNIEKGIAMTQYDIERAFERSASAIRPPMDFFASSPSSNHVTTLSSARLDELLGRPMELDSVQDLRTDPSIPHHRHTQSALGRMEQNDVRLFTNVHAATSRSTPRTSPRERTSSTNSVGSGSGNLKRVNSIGHIQQDVYQPPLMEQARLRSATSAVESQQERVAEKAETTTRHRRRPTGPSGRHSRKGSGVSMENMLVWNGTEALLNIDDLSKASDNVASYQHPDAAIVRRASSRQPATP